MSESTEEQKQELAAKLAADEAARKARADASGKQPAIPPASTAPVAVKEEEGKGAATDKASAGLPDLASVIKRRRKEVLSPLSKRVNVKDLMQKEYNIQSNNVMSSSDIEAISMIFTDSGISEDVQQDVAIEVARMAVDVGSSKHSEFIGRSKFADIEMASVVGMIKEVTTLRRFCMYYAKLIWNLLMKEKVPPANWAKKGFKEADKFAAFDFFVGVFDESALEPDGGLVRQPTQRELNANLASFEIRVFRQTLAEGNRSLNLGEISGGAAGSAPHNPFQGK